MPSTDRLPRPSHCRTLLPNRPTTVRALAVSRHQLRASPVHLPLSRLAPQSLHSRPLDHPRSPSPVPFDPHSWRRRLVIRFFRRWFPVIVNREFGYQLLDRVLHPLKLFLVQNAALRVDGGEL